MDSKIDEVKKQISIPDYFGEVIVPQLTDYYSGSYGVDFDLSPYVKCPLHNEDTPSFRFYGDTSTFYCFGCGKGGDVVELHRRFIQSLTGTEPSFKSSVDFLYNYFILGNKSTNTVNTKSTIDKDAERLEASRNGLKIYDNTVESKIYAGRYISKLEEMLKDNSISLEKRMKLWALKDNLEILISRDFVDSRDAIKYLKNTVKNVVEAKESN